MTKIYQVSEAAEELETEVYTLRYWENQLGLEVPRNAAGHRYYEEEQMTLFQNVKRLKEWGFSLREIKAMGQRMSAVAELSDEKLASLRKKLSGIEEEAEKEGEEKRKNEAEEIKSETTETGNLPQYVEKAQETKTITAEDRAEGVRLLQEGMTRWLGEVLQRNNEQLTQKIEDGVSERMARELRFLFRQQEEREEERYRRLDRVIRERQQARTGAKMQTTNRDNFMLTRKLRSLR